MELSVRRYGAQHGIGLRTGIDKEQDLARRLDALAAAEVDPALTYPGEKSGAARDRPRAQEACIRFRGSSLTRSTPSLKCRWCPLEWLP